MENKIKWTTKQRIRIGLMFLIVGLVLFKVNLSGSGKDKNIYTLIIYCIVGVSLIILVLFFTREKKENEEK